MKILQSFADCQGVKTLTVNIRLRNFEISIPIYMQSFNEIELKFKIKFLNQNSKLTFKMEIQNWNSKLKFKIEIPFAGCQRLNILTVSIILRDFHAVFILNCKLQLKLNWNEFLNLKMKSNIDIRNWNSISRLKWR